MARWEEEDYWDDEGELVPIEQELVRSIYIVPDSYWGFEAFMREAHPGVCIACDRLARITFFCKGTDPRSARGLVVEVDPSKMNGLGKRTAFALEPRRIRLHKALTLHPDKQLGRIEDGPFADMLAHLLTVFPPQEGRA